MSFIKLRAQAIAIYKDCAKDLRLRELEREIAGLPLGNLAEIRAWYERRIEKLKAWQNREMFSSIYNWK